MNAVYLTTYGMGVPFHLYLTKDVPVAKPDDLSGMRFRGQPNYNAIFKHYNIASVNIAPPEVFTALERGVVQGYGYPLWGIDDFGWDKLTKMRIDPGFYNVVVNILMNKTSYDKLTPAQRKVHRRRGRLVREGHDRLYRRDHEGIARCDGKGRHQDRRFRSGVEEDRARTLLGRSEEAEPGFDRQAAAAPDQEIERVRVLARSERFVSMRAIFWLNGWLVRMLCVLAVLLIAAMMLGISAEVILRMFGFPSIIGLIELTEYALFISTFFVAPYLLRTNEHIRVDLVMRAARSGQDRVSVECGVLAVIMVISLITGVIGDHAAWFAAIRPAR